MTMTRIDWIVDQIMRFMFYLADGFPVVNTLSATAKGEGAFSFNENDNDDDHSNDDDSDTSEAGNYCVVDGAQGTKSTEIPIKDKDESAL